MRYSVTQHTPNISVKPRIEKPSKPCSKNWRFQAPHCCRSLFFAQVPIGTLTFRSEIFCRPASLNASAGFQKKGLPIFFPTASKILTQVLSGESGLILLSSALASPHNSTCSIQPPGLRCLYTS